MIRVGFGFDLHPLVAGRPLRLGGVTVPADRGLAGHSDADVLTHALCEALLGALALGDLGTHFPDTDPRYRAISSLLLLEEVRKVVEARGARVVNADATVLAEAPPRLQAFLPEMAKRLADALELSVERVSVKAKSPEGLGLLGRREGMAAMVVVSMEVRGAAVRRAKPLIPRRVRQRPGRGAARGWSRAARAKSRARREARPELNEPSR